MFSFWILPSHFNLCDFSLQSNQQTKLCLGLCTFLCCHAALSCNQFILRIEWLMSRRSSHAVYLLTGWCYCWLRTWAWFYSHTITRIIIIIHSTSIAPNPTRLAQSTSQFKTRMNIRINTWNMHTPDDPTPTAKCRQTCTHPGSVSATWTQNTAIHGPWTHLMIANQIQRAS